MAFEEAANPPHPAALGHVKGEEWDARFSRIIQARKKKEER